MRRRDFLGVLGGAVAAWPLGARAQQIAKLPTIGFMGSATSSISAQWVKAFVERLRAHDWTEGRTVSIEYRWAEGSYERAARIATEFVQMKVEVIVTSSTPNVLATKQATSEIPIIFASAGDPVGSGLVASLARPGGNATGLSIQAAEISGKRIELLREALHGLSRLAIMGNGDNSAVVAEMRETRAAAEKIGLDARIFEIRRPEDIRPTFETLKGHFDALFVPAEPLANTNRRRISSLALAVHLPSLGLKKTAEILTNSTAIDDVCSRSVPVFHWRNIGWTCFIEERSPAPSQRWRGQTLALTVQSKTAQLAPVAPPGQCTFSVS